MVTVRCDICGKVIPSFSKKTEFALPYDTMEIHYNMTQYKYHKDMCLKCAEKVAERIEELREEENKNGDD